MDDVYRTTGTFKPLLQQQSNQKNGYPQQQQLNQINEQIDYQQQQSSKKFQYQRFQFKDSNDALNIRILDNLTVQQEQDIEAITPVVKNIVSSKINFNELNYQQYLKIFNICKFAVNHYIQQQSGMQSLAEDRYDHYKELENIKTGLNDLKNQHVAKKNSLLEKMKSLQWQINQLKHEAENMGMFKCMHCSHQFKEKIALERHIRKMHRDLIEEINATKIMQNEQRDPLTLAKHEIIEQKRIENLTQFDKQLSDKGYVNTFKEDELVTRVMKLLQQKQADKIAKEFMVAENLQADEIVGKQQNRQVMLDSITDLKGSIDNFKLLFDQLKQQQQILEKQQQEYQTRLKSVLEKQKDMHVTEKQVHQNVEEYMRNPKKFFEQQLQEEQELKLEKISRERRLQEVQQLLFLKQEELDRKQMLIQKKVVPEEQDDLEREDSGSEKGTNSYEIDVTATTNKEEEFSQLGQRQDFALGGPSKMSIKVPKVLAREDLDEDLEHIGELESDVDSEFDDERMISDILNNTPIEQQQNLLLPLNVNKKMMEAENLFMQAIVKRQIYNFDDKEEIKKQIELDDGETDKKKKQLQKEEQQDKKKEDIDANMDGQDVLKKSDDVLKSKNIQEELKTPQQLLKKEEKERQEFDLKRKILQEKCDEILKTSNHYSMSQLQGMPIHDIEIMFTKLKKDDNVGGINRSSASNSVINKSSINQIKQ